MNERNKRIEVRVTEKEKKILTKYANCCGLSLSEFLRKRGLGYEPRPLLSDSIYPFYSKLCELCNQRMSTGVETMLLALITDIRRELLLPQKQAGKEMDTWQQPDSGLSKEG